MYGVSYKKERNELDAPTSRFHGREIAELQALLGIPARSVNKQKYPDTFMVTKYTSITCDASVPISEAFPSLPLPFRFDLHDS